jgi:pyruvate,water dikinase
MSGRVLALADARDERAFGGKAAQLGASLRAGLPVPDGLALDADLVEAIALGASRGEEALAYIDERVRAPLAARSSAVGEDSAGASFAGQHRTVLGVRGIAALRAAVRDVWSSARSAAALAYRRRLGLGDSDPRIGVVIQPMIGAACAGVLFTRNPIDGADERVIEAAWGLGESVVAGLVVPDRYRVSRDGRVLEATPGRKDVSLRLAASGGTEEVEIDPRRAVAACLSPSDLCALHALASACERAFGAELDLEWALTPERLHLLQCRPITRVMVTEATCRR